MKLLKYLFLLLLLLLLGSAAYVALMNGEYRLEKTIETTSPKSLLFNQVDNLKNWKNWNKEQTENTKIDYSENTKGEDAYAKWINKSSNRTIKLTTEEVITNSKIKQKAVSEGRMTKTNYTLEWNFAQQKNGSQVALLIKMKQNFWTKALNLTKQKDYPEKDLMKKVTEKLNNLKNKVAEDMKVYSINVDGVITNQEKNFLYITQATTNQPEKITNLHDSLINQLLEITENQGLKTDDTSMVIFNSKDSRNNAIISVAVPVIDSLDYEDPLNKIMIGNLPEHKAVKATLKGDYKNISELWDAAENYISENQLEKDKEINPFEVLKTTSSQTENPAEQLTELYIPIKEVELMTPLPIERDSI